MFSTLARRTINRTTTNTCHRYFCSPASKPSKPKSSLRIRFTSFITGVAVAGGTGAYFFYWHLNDTANEINDGVVQLGDKFKKDTSKLKSDIIKLQQRLEMVEASMAVKQAPPQSD